MALGACAVTVDGRWTAAARISAEHILSRLGHRAIPIKRTALLHGTVYIAAVLKSPLCIRGRLRPPPSHHALPHGFRPTQLVRQLHRTGPRDVSPRLAWPLLAVDCWLGPRARDGAAPPRKQKPQPNSAWYVHAQLRTFDSVLSAPPRAAQERTSGPAWRVLRPARSIG